MNAIYSNYAFICMNSMSEYVKPRKNEFLRKFENFYFEIPFLSKLPPKVSVPIFSLISVNIVVWIVAAIVISLVNRSLFLSVLLSWTLGLRHALDADHITAIDNLTRRLLSTDKPMSTVGTWFSIGHSTVVLITCIVVAATSSKFADRWNNFQTIGGIIGTSVSMGLLLLLAIGNTVLLVRLSYWLWMYRKSGVTKDEGVTGFLARKMQRLFRLVDSPWKIYVLGFVFGLGFDTSTEVSLLGIATLQALKGTSIWAILLFPIVFLVGMCLVDTTDGALMYYAYSYSSGETNPYFSRLYYSIILTFVSVIAAFTIGIIQMLMLIISVHPMESTFWNGLNRLSDNYEIVGGCICGAFVLAGLFGISMHNYFKKKFTPPVQVGNDREDEVLEKNKELENVSKNSISVQISESEKVSYDTVDSKV